ncbi:hypothetical protein M433DRAFT_131706 [Acidomyces richmondensis BFW]|nr:MAG: hypothetical protein FE78DRAFT_26458 [Acidomyces sp. 'richmondensis']KYG48897.1 hypothetical protein M433DRAFT_131706 [Acidomyces richmondensis BFW]
MLSRSNSNAGERLRRAKSTSSQHTASSGHHRTSTSIDPFVTRQQAEAAAVEAYYRAKQYDEPARQNYRPVPQKIQRRRSNKTGRTEGSHLEEARLGRRRSNSTRGDGKATQASLVRPQRVTESNAEGSAEEDNTIPHKRSFIPSSVAFSRQSNSDELTGPTTIHRIRKTQSVYADGSPIPRHAAKLKERSSTLQLNNMPSQSNADGYGGKVQQDSTSEGPPEFTNRSLTSQWPCVKEAHIHGGSSSILNDASHGPQQKVVRERKSMFLAPFQKRRPVAAQKTGDNGYDTSLPPFNYAAEPSLQIPAVLVEPSTPTPSPIIVMEKKRNFTSIKGRIKNVFRKSSRLPAEIPPQHIEATHFHYSASEEAYHSLSGKKSDPFLARSEENFLGPPRVNADNASSHRSASRFSDTGSRVTSWANSTAAGTCTSRADPDLLPTVDERGGLEPVSTQSTLRRKTSAFFGGPVKNKLRRSSKVKLSNSEETNGLYHALQLRMRPANRATTPEPCVSDAEQEQPALGSLPTEQHAAKSISSVRKYSISTIRNVTPDPNACHIGTCSPVLEVKSPAGITDQDTSFDCGARGNPAQLSVTEEATPTLDQLERRMEKSRNRWQSPLDELCPPAPAGHRPDMEDNPYELRSLSQSHPQPPVQSDLPHHARVGQAEQADMAGIMSPSVYSRATDGASPRPDTPADQAGMVVTITGREVKSYSISPPKQRSQGQERSAQTSGQWRRWLSGEMSSMKEAEGDFKLAEAFLQDGAIDSRSTSRQASDRNDSSRCASASPAVEARPSSSVGAATVRPRVASSRRSSFMNDRYPMIDTSRNSSDQSIRSRSRISSYAADHRKNATGVNTDSQAKAASTSRRIITGKHSLAQLETKARTMTTNSFGDPPEPYMSGALAMQDGKPAAPVDDKASLPSEQRRPVLTAAKHKSAFELRATYKNSSTGRSTPLEIRRKPTNGTVESRDMLDDSTLLNISAGPYATTNEPFDTGRTSTGAKENFRPASDAASLPALSSSEWLATGANKARRPTKLHPALRNRNVSKYSPIKRTSCCGSKSGEERGSPAQRMASEWLERRSRESTPTAPAFV